MAACLGLGFALWLYKYPMLRGTAPFWWREDADITQYLAGFNAFVHEPWHWPLLRIDSLNTPDGTLATFLDTIPLYAMFLKLVHPGAGYWNPYGLWIALCFALQGVGAWWICREARLRNWAALVALALLLAAFPALTRRIPHTSLMSQWLLLFGLAVYLRSGRLGRIATGSWVVLLNCAFYINIYLFAMTSALFAADVLRELLRTPYKRSSIVRALLAPLAVYGVLFATMLVTMLPLPLGAGNGEWGFGYYSMNLLSPLNGGQLLHFEHPESQPGQGEGHNYLGIFLLSLTFFVYKLRQAHDCHFLRRHCALLGVLAVLTLYALSNRVYLGETLVYTLQLPQQLDGVTSTFRSSGRFFWPVGYAIVVFTVLGLVRHLKAGQAAAVLMVLLLLHFWDLQPHNDRVRAEIAQASGHSINAAQWEAFLGTKVRALHYYPPFHCAPTSPSAALLPTMAYAVRHGYSMSTGYIARAVKPCTGYAADIMNLPANTAVVFDKQVFTRQDAAEQLMGANATCADMQIVFLCRRDITNLDKKIHEKISLVGRTFL
ncbi:hypothetical protein AM586_23805 [Massilia sp. WG5]|nr:hypothetical protein AM586_23805 [Massilia sp. WG5]